MFRLSGSSGQIVEVLSNEFPLSIKEIHSKLKRNFAAEVTYQAVHKKVGELQSEGIIDKTGKKYLLSHSWIEEGKEFFAGLDSRYSNKSLSSLVPEDNQSVTHTFSSPLELGSFLIDFATKFPDESNKGIVALWWAYYPTFSLSEKQYKQLRETLKLNNFHILVHSKTNVDLSLEREYIQLGAKIKLGADSPINPDTFVKGDYVCFVYFPKKFRAGWEKYSNESKKLPRKVIAFANLLSIIYDTKAGFNIMIAKNPKLAEQIRSDVLSNFK